MGSAVSGVMSSLPILSYINIFLCIVNMAGILFALWMYLRAYPDDKLTTRESLVFGAIAGAGAGLIATLLTPILLVLLSAMLDSQVVGISTTGTFHLALPIAIFGAQEIVTLPLWIILYAAFGLLGSFLGMQLFFKSRIRKV
jgi:hypothetical protein